MVRGKLRKHKEELELNFQILCNLINLIILNNEDGNKNEFLFWTVEIFEDLRGFSFEES